MNKNNEVAFWNELKGKLKQKYPQLNNSDLQWRDGSQKDIIEIIAVKLGKSTRELQEEIDLL